eukprot:TRINITY_DN54769_c0_g1_i1.p1 TRINITY_DN54769_c0_g1~~TRINITY_DN54769_c0_g1_i1.p1  ORF type:complete len:738 (-),score=96.23 TRINITY_DN54769_c0_g1_i1:320-2344(-)
MTARKFEDVIEDIGVGACQLRLAILGGASMFFLGEIQSLSALLPEAIVVDTGRVARLEPLLAAIPYLGLSFGYALSFLIDQCGRRSMVLLGMFGFVGSIYASTLGSSVAVVAPFWFWSGVWCGLAVGAYCSLLTDISPSSWRLAVMALSSVLWGTGAILVVQLVWLLGSDVESLAVQWRSIVRHLQIVNAVLFVFAIYPGFVESPVSFLSAGNYLGAVDQLKLIWKQNGSPDVCLDFSYQQSNLSCFAFFDASAVRTTIALLFAVVMNWLVIAGMMFGLPRFPPNKQMSELSLVACFLAAHTLGRITPAVLDRTTQRLHMKAVLILCSASCVLLAVGVLMLDASIVEVTKSRRGLGVPISFAATCAIAYSAGVLHALNFSLPQEIRLSKVREMSVAICSVIGSFGGLAAVWLFDVLAAGTGTVANFFVVCAGGCLVVAALMHNILGPLQDRDDVPNSDGLTLASLEGRLSQRRSNDGTRRHPWSTLGRLSSHGSAKSDSTDATEIFKDRFAEILGQLALVLRGKVEHLSSSEQSSAVATKCYVGARQGKAVHASMDSAGRLGRASVGSNEDVLKSVNTVEGWHAGFLGWWTSEHDFIANEFPPCHILLAAITNVSLDPKDPERVIVQTDNTDDGVHIFIFKSWQDAATWSTTLATLVEQLREEGYDADSTYDGG